MARRVDFSADVILVCNSLDAGGIERVVSTLANEWSRRGRGVSVLTLHDRRRFYRLDRGYHSFVYSSEAVLLRRALRRADSPLVVSLGTPINIVALKACRGLGRRLVISERNDPRRLSRYKQWDVRARLLYSHADLVTADTRGALRDMGEYVGAAKLAFVPNPLPLARVVWHGGVPDPYALYHSAAIFALPSRVSEYDLPRALAARESALGLA